MTSPVAVSFRNSYADTMIASRWLTDVTAKATLVDTSYVWNEVLPLTPTAEQIIAEQALVNRQVFNKCALADNLWISGHAPRKLVGGIVISTQATDGAVWLARCFLPFAPEKEWVTPEGPFWIVWQDGGVWNLW